MPPAPTKHEIRQQLSALGVSEGDTLMVHASLRRLGPIDAGGQSSADAILDVLLALLGESGTLLMVLSADPDDPFDPLTTPVHVDDMGVLAEVFRTHPGVQVNDHPDARFGAMCARADWLLYPAPLSDYFGEGSVLERLVACGGKVLRLGADIDTITLAHHAEYLAELPDKRRATYTYTLAEGKAVLRKDTRDATETSLRRGHTVHVLDAVPLRSPSDDPASEPATEPATVAIEERKYDLNAAPHTVIRRHTSACEAKDLASLVTRTLVVGSVEDADPTSTWEFFTDGRVFTLRWCPLGRVPGDLAEPNRAWWPRIQRLGERRA